MYMRPLKGPQYRATRCLACITRRFWLAAASGAVSVSKHAGLHRHAIIAVARTCKNLVKLGMSEVEILNSGAVEIGNNLSLLEELRIGRHKLSKVGLQALGNLYSLKSLKILGLGESADVDIQAVLQPSLAARRKVQVISRCGPGERGRGEACRHSARHETDCSGPMHATAALP